MTKTIWRFVQAMGMNYTSWLIVNVCVLDIMWFIRLGETKLDQDSYAYQDPLEDSN